ncbi:MAG: hypothetical protein R3C20_01360 [Planctomycetaceae bacterium]
MLILRSRTFTVFLLLMISLISNCSVQTCASEAGNLVRSPATSQVEFLRGREVMQALQEVTAWSAEGVSLAQHLNDWQSSTRVQIIRDRRIDPHQIIKVSAFTGTRAGILTQITDAIPGVAWCLAEDFIYLGPAESAWRLPSLLSYQKKNAQDLRRTLKGTQIRISASSVTTWPRASAPRDLLNQRFSDSGVALIGTESVPHDLWSAGEWPSMNSLEFGTVLLNQFDLMLTAGKSGTELQIASIDPSLTIEAVYAFNKEHRESLAQSAAESVPGAGIRWAGGTVRVTGTIADHTWFQREVHRSRWASISNGQLTDSLRTRRFSLTVENATLRALVDSLGQNGITIELPETDPASDEGRRFEKLMASPVDVKAVGQPGIEFFPGVFGRFFGKVIVEEDRVRLEGVSGGTGK